MVGVATTFSPIWLSSPTIIKSTSWNSNPRICSPEAFPTNPLDKPHSLSLSSAFPPHFSLQKDFKRHAQDLSLKAAASSSSSSSSSSVGSAEFTEEPATNVKFQTSVSLPGCLSPLSLLGTGYREKVFAIIGVKVYAAGLYLNQSIIDILDAWKGQPASAIREASSLFDSIFQAPQEKSLHIVLVRDVDGKTFWDALDDAVSPRIKPPTAVDESALSTFRSIFQGRSLKKGTSIFLTWLQPGKMFVCVSSDGLPSGIDATIESNNVTLALFDVFLGPDPVSPSLKASVADRLATILK